MALWDKVRDELDRAGRAAQTAIDDGRIRLEAMRARRRADGVAREIGYAVYRARAEGRELDAEGYARLSSALAAHEAEVTRLEAQLAALRTRPASAQPLTGPVRDGPVDQPAAPRTGD